MFKCCIFDLDGTLLDTVKSLWHAGNQMLETFGLPSMPAENYNYYAGDGAAELVRRCLADAGDRELAHFSEALPVYLDCLAKDPYYELKHFPGMPEAIQGLKALGLPLAVFSNKPHLQAVEVVELMFGSDCFAKIRGQKDGMPKKPNPLGALKIAEELGASPSDCLYVGDTWTDMETGHNAGMFTAGVTWGFRPESELVKHRADVIIHTPAELLSFVKQNERELPSKGKP